MVKFLLINFGLEILQLKDIFNKLTTDLDCISIKLKIFKVLYFNGWIVFAEIDLLISPN